MHTPLSLFSPQEAYKNGFYQNAAGAFAAARLDDDYSRDADTDGRDLLSSLACQADAALCGVRAFGATMMHCNPRQVLVFRKLLAHAVDCNRFYAQALWNLATRTKDVDGPTTRNEQQQQRFQYKAVRSILQATETCVWLYLQTSHVDLALDRIMDDLHSIILYLSSTCSPCVWKSCTLQELMFLAENLLGNTCCGKSLMHLRQTLSIIGVALGESSSTGESTGSVPPLVAVTTKPALGESSSTGESTGSVPPLVAVTTKPNNTIVLPDIRDEIRRFILDALVMHRNLATSGVVMNDGRRRLEIIRQRNRMLQQAAELECSMEHSSTTLARRTRATLLALDALSDTLCVDAEKALGCAQELERWITRDISCAHWNLLGCLQARYGDIHHALRSFQQSDEIRPGRTETILNMAECFLCMGQVDVALSLLSLPAGQTIPWVSQMVASEVLVMSLAPSRCDVLLKEQLYWSQIVAASLMKVRSDTLLEAIDLLQSSTTNKNTYWATALFAFACLQAECPRRAMRAIRARKMQVSVSDSMEQLLLDLYEAEALVQTSRDMATAGDKLNAALSILVAQQESHSHASHSEIHSCILNNQGVLELMNGKVGTALSCFYSSCEHIETSRKRSRPALVPRFNLALLSWKQHNIPCALDHWMHAQGVDSKHMKSLRLAFLGQEETEEYWTGCWQPMSSTTTRDMVLLDVVLLEAARRLKNSAVWIQFLSQQCNSDNEDRDAAIE